MTFIQQWMQIFGPPRTSRSESAGGVVPGEVLADRRCDLIRIPERLPGTDESSGADLLMFVPGDQLHVKVIGRPIAHRHQVDAPGPRKGGPDRPRDPGAHREQVRRTAVVKAGEVVHMLTPDHDRVTRCPGIAGERGEEPAVLIEDVLRPHDGAVRPLVDALVAPPVHRPSRPQSASPQPCDTKTTHGRGRAC
jgi:hypothetical protein